MKKLLTIFVLVLLLYFISSCGGTMKNGKILDYYREYLFELPFNHNITALTNTLNFKKEYSMEQMCQLINEAGYNAQLYENGNVRRILISAEKDTFTYYFIIYDSNYLYNNGEIYTLSDASSVIWIDKHETLERGVPYMYVFLAPLHILEITNNINSGRREIYGSFDDVANFYRATGKNDVQVDDDSKLIIFECEGKKNYSWRQGKIFMQYIETESGNYLNIEYE